MLELAISLPPPIQYGTTGNDILQGNCAKFNDLTTFGTKKIKDIIDGGEGIDIIWGYAGDDTLNGNNYDDVIDGGLGKDFIFGDDGKDRLYGGYENESDQLWGSNASTAPNNKIDTFIIRINTEAPSATQYSSIIRDYNMYDAIKLEFYDNKAHYSKCNKNNSVNTSFTTITIYNNDNSRVTARGCAVTITCNNNISDKFFVFASSGDVCTSIKNKLTPKLNI